VTDDDGTTAHTTDVLERESAGDETPTETAGTDATPEEPEIRGGLLSVVTAELDTRLVGRAAIAGVWSFVTGYLLTLVIVVLGPSRTGGGVRGVLNVVAFIFYSAQNVSTVSPKVSYNELVQQQQYGDPAVPIAVFFALPMVVLFLTGVAYAARELGDDVTLDRVGQATLGLAVGYAAVSLLGTFVVTLDVSHPSHVRALLFGLAYPIAFCLLGGVAVLGWRRRSTGE
jgi:hypothetical protein